LMEQTQGLWAAYPMLDARRMFRLYRALLDRVPVYALEYHRCRGVLPDLVHTIRGVAASRVPAGTGETDAAPVVSAIQPHRCAALPRPRWEPRWRQASKSANG